jgi:hypothetical protein
MPPGEADEEQGSLCGVSPKVLEDQLELGDALFHKKVEQSEAAVQCTAEDDIPGDVAIDAQPSQRSANGSFLEVVELGHGEGVDKEIEDHCWHKTGKIGEPNFIGGKAAFEESHRVRFGLLGQLEEVGLH